MGGTPPPSPPSFTDNPLPHDNIIQLDGNISLNSTMENEPLSSSIPVIIGHRPGKSTDSERPPSTRKIVRRSNKAIQALTLPTVVIYNMRSLFPKIENFSLDMKERAGDIAFLTEIWEKKEHRKQSLKKCWNWGVSSILAPPAQDPKEGVGQLWQ